MLLTAGQDRARLWHVASQLPVGQPLRHTKAVRIATFCRGDSSILTDGDELTSRVWSVSGTLAPQSNWSSGGSALGAVLSDDERWLVAPCGILFDADREKQKGLVLLRDLKDPARRRKAELLVPDPRPLPVRAVDYNKDASLLLIATGDEDRKLGMSYLWRKGKDNLWEVFSFEQKHAVQTVALGETHFAGGGSEGVVFLYQYDPRHPGNANRIARFPRKGEIGKIFSLAFSPDGKTLISGSRDGIARLWDVATGEELCQWRHPDTVLSTTFTRDGKRLATGYVGGARVGKLHREGGKHRIEQEGPTLPHQAGVLGISFSKDGNRLLTGGTDGIVWLWDAATFKPACPPWLGHGTVFGVIFAPDGDHVLSASNNSMMQGSLKRWLIPRPIERQARRIPSTGSTRRREWHWTTRPRRCWIRKAGFVFGRKGALYQNSRNAFLGSNPSSIFRPGECLPRFSWIRPGSNPC